MKRQRGKAKIKIKANKKPSQIPPPNSLLCKAWDQSSGYGIPFPECWKASREPWEVSMMTTGSWGCCHFSGWMSPHLLKHWTAGLKWQKSNIQVCAGGPDGEQSWGGLKVSVPNLSWKSFVLGQFSPVQTGRAGCLEVCFPFITKRQSRKVIVSLGIEGHVQHSWQPRLALWDMKGDYWFERQHAATWPKGTK